MKVNKPWRYLDIFYTCNHWGISFQEIKKKGKTKEEEEGEEWWLDEIALTKFSALVIRTIYLKTMQVTTQQNNHNKHVTASTGMLGKQFSAYYSHYIKSLGARWRRGRGGWLGGAACWEWSWRKTGRSRVLPVAKKKKGNKWWSKLGTNDSGQWSRIQLVFPGVKPEKWDSSQTIGVKRRNIRLQHEVKKKTLKGHGGVHFFCFVFLPPPPCFFFLRPPHPDFKNWLKVNQLQEPSRSTTTPFKLLRLNSLQFNKTFSEVASPLRSLTWG